MVTVYAARYKSSNSRGEATPARIPGQNPAHTGVTALDMQFSSIGNGCSSLLGATAGQPYGYALSSPCLGVTASTEKKRMLRLLNYVEHARTGEYKKDSNSQSTVLRSELIITHQTRTSRSQRHSRRSNLYIFTPAVYRDFLKTCKFSSVLPCKKQCSPHSPPP